MVKLFLLYAILIFAKKAPKMITDLLNIKSEGLGLKGLNIKNKMGEAALVGGAVKKGMTDVHGRMRKGAAGFAAGLLHGDGKLKDRLKLPDRDPETGKRIPGTGGSAFRGLMSGITSGGKEARENGENGVKGLWSKGYNDTKNVIRGGEPTAKGKLGGKLDKINTAVGSYGYSSLTNAHAREAENFKKALEEKYGKDAANQLMHALALKHGVNGRIRFDQNDEYEAYKKDLKAIAEAYTPTNVKNILASDKDMVKDKVGYVPGGVTAIGNLDELMENLDIETYGTGVLMKKDLLTERGKALVKIQNAQTDYNNAMQIHDEKAAEVALQARDKVLKEAKANGLFDDYNDAYGVEGLGEAFELKPVGTDFAGKPIYNFFSSVGVDAEGRTVYGFDFDGMPVYERDAKIITNMANTIDKNNKQLKGTENDIQGMKAVEAESGKGNGK